MNKNLIALFMLCSMILLAGSVLGATDSDLYGDFSLANNAPTIPYVAPTASANPTESSTTTVYVVFNATDTDGYANIDTATAQAQMIKGGETTRTSSGCTNSNDGADTVIFNCTIAMQFYDGDGSWTVNASVQDINDAMATNTSTSFTYGTLSAMTVDISAITFGASLNLGDSDQGANDTTVLTNTGNQPFTTINVKGQDFVGETTPGETVDASAFEVAISNTPNSGDALVENTNVQVTSATLPDGSSSTEELWYFLDVPSSGLSEQTYSTSTLWNINVAS